MTFEELIGKTVIKDRFNNDCYKNGLILTHFESEFDYAKASSEMRYLGKLCLYLLNVEPSGETAFTEHERIFTDYYIFKKFPKETFLKKMAEHADEASKVKAILDLIRQLRAVKKYDGILFTTFENFVSKATPEQAIQYAYHFGDIVHHFPFMFPDVTDIEGACRDKGLEFLSADSIKKKMNVSQPEPDRKGSKDEKQDNPLTGRYLCSEATFLRVESYLKALVAGTEKPGNQLAKALARAEITDFKTMTAKQLLVHLMNSRIPQVYAETLSFSGNTLHWNDAETQILGGVSFSTTGTHAYNNGAHSGKQVDHPEHNPLETNFLFVSGALLKNNSADMKDIISNGDINEEALYKLYKSRLLPGLLIQNAIAKERGIKLVVNVPGVGCSLFAGSFKNLVRIAFPRVLKRILDINGLDMIDVVNFDPYEKPNEDEFTTERGGLAHNNMKLMCRPLLGLPEGAPGSVASQLEFPKDGTDYSKHQLLKIVAWDHFSFPGNDIWADGRNTDDGVSFASSDTILAMFKMGQIRLGQSDIKIEYDTKRGVVFVVNPKTRTAVTYDDLIKLEEYSSNVTEDMIDVVSSAGIILTQASVETHVPRKGTEASSSEAWSGSETESKDDQTEIDKGIQKNKSEFISRKNEIQDKFQACLIALQKELKKNSEFEAEGSRLYNVLNAAQDAFFKGLTPVLTENELKTVITDFYKKCNDELAISDKIMGHGWLYRIVEVTLKAVFFLFAGIGMVLGSVFAQGLANAEHRQKFKNTFFAWDQTRESEALSSFKHAVSDENEVRDVEEQLIPSKGKGV